MQLASTTDYAIRIVCYLAAQRQMISTSELSQELSVPSSYIPKITKKLKQAGIIKACEGTNGGYMLAKQPENISLMEIISCVEETQWQLIVVWKIKVTNEGKRLEVQI